MGPRLLHGSLGIAIMLLLATPTLTAQAIIHKEVLIGHWHPVHEDPRLQLKITDLYTGNRSLLQIHYEIGEADEELESDQPLFWSWQRRRWENEDVTITAVDVHIVFTHMPSGTRLVIVPKKTAKGPLALASPAAGAAPVR